MNKLIAAAFAVFAASQSCSFAFVGVNYGPYHLPNQGPPNPIPDSQFRSDLEKISGKYTYIRTYTVDPKARMDQLVPFIAQNFSQMKVYLGVWEFRDASETKTSLDIAIALANDPKYTHIIECIVVGNEHPDLGAVIGDIKYVKSKLTGAARENVKVTSCLTFKQAMDNGPDFLEKSQADFLMLNVYPFFAGIPIAEAIENTIIYGYKAGQSKAGGKPVILGEVGWPSEGPATGPAIPSAPNEQQYITDVTNASKDGRLGSIFIFEAFDEPWKTWNPVEAHFGLWKADGPRSFPSRRANKEVLYLLTVCQHSRN